MAKFSYKNNRKKPKYLSLLSYVVFGLIAIWLVASMYFKVSPFQIITNGFKSIGQAGSQESVESLKIEIAKRDSIIFELTNKLQESNGSSLKKALVKISSNTLNMRSSASLTSDIVLQIPAESEVDILYYDTEVYYLEGKAGKWCKIKYAGEEGWVWGNFLLEVE